VAMNFVNALRMRLLTPLLVVASLLPAGCGKPQNQAPATPPAAQVGVVTVRAQAVPLTHDLVGRLSATRQADVRARVPGVLEKRL
jgi:membrane fusion protein, multidrug efflux system